MKLAGSVQSLDPDVQENIKRKNISANEIVDMALKSSEIGANTYSEVILGLPGDTIYIRPKFTDGGRDVNESGNGNINVTNKVCSIIMD